MAPGKNIDSHTRKIIALLLIELLQEVAVLNRHGRIQNAVASHGYEDRPDFSARFCVSLW